MSKRETTMEALKYTIDLFKNRSQITFSCHDYFINMLEMAYDLLKEQEAVVPNRGLAKTQKAWFCGACGFRLNRAGRFCSSCGRAVKWG